MRGILALPGCRGKDSERGLHGQARPRARPRRRAGSRSRTPVARGDRALVAAAGRLRGGAIIGLLVSLGGGKRGRRRPRSTSASRCRRAERRSRARRRASDLRPRTSTSLYALTPGVEGVGHSRGAAERQDRGQADPRPDRHEDRTAGAVDAAVGDRLEGREDPDRRGHARQARGLAVPALSEQEDRDHPGSPRRRSRLRSSTSTAG